MASLVDDLLEDEPFLMRPLAVRVYSLIHSPVIALSWLLDKFIIYKSKYDVWILQNIIKTTIIEISKQNNINFLLRIERKNLTNDMV
jgi:hypothetical protein